MSFPLPAAPSTVLNAPGQLFHKPGPVALPALPALPTLQGPVATATTLPVSRSLPAAPLLRPVTPSPLTRVDQSQFSLVSRLLGPLDQISLPPLRNIVPAPVLAGLERGWQALKDTFTYQFEEIGRTGTSREADANCGPASASMVLKQFGIYPPTMQQLRRLVGAPIGYGGDAFALTTKQVAEAVKRTASEKGKYISYDTRLITSNVDSVTSEMRNRLARGEKLILLTSGFNSLSQGHFTVVKEVRNDGSVVVDDPGTAGGENRVISRSRLAKALETRKYEYGMENVLIAFSG
ncbi:MAG: hypothetical protein IV090_13420 [Candidatus Sericytochromatia bacterium]|nr:hypothetical protein [Candidatus Sericytochromatia bacterium]